MPADRAEQPVREFEAFTTDLYRLADWLAGCGVETVVMESTGVYWIPLFGVLEERGFQVMLVDPRCIKNVPGRKTDVRDCQWLPSICTSMPSWGMRRRRKRCCWERRRRGLPMPALTRIRRNVGRLRSMPSRSRSSSVR